MKQWPDMDLPPSQTTHFPLLLPSVALTAHPIELLHWIHLHFIVFCMSIAGLHMSHLVMISTHFL